PGAGPSDELRQLDSTGDDRLESPPPQRMVTSDAGMDAARSTIEFVPDRPARESESTLLGFPLHTLEPVPQDVLVFWEEECADQHKRVVAVAVGDKLKLLRITIGRQNALDVIHEATIDDEPGSVRTQVVTRDALLMWAEPAARTGRGVGKTIVLRIGTRLKLVRVSGDEAAPAIEILDAIELGG